MGEDPADGLTAEGDGVGRDGHGGDGGGFGLAVADDEVSEVHARDESAHRFVWDGRTCCDSGPAAIFVSAMSGREDEMNSPQGREVKLAQIGQVGHVKTLFEVIQQRKLREEHGGNTMKRCALLLMDGAKGEGCVECL